MSCHEHIIAISIITASIVIISYNERGVWRDSAVMPGLVSYNDYNDYSYMGGG